MTIPDRGNAALFVRRFEVKVNRSGPVSEHRPDLGSCWLWTACITGGYGRFHVGGSPRYAHRISYELYVGPIPEGLHLDHLCRVTHCVNPDHLEPVTHIENVRRGLHGVLTTHCPQGHPYSGENLYVWRGHRRCRICLRQAVADHRARKAVA